MPKTHDQIAKELMARWPEHRPQPSLSRISALCDLLGNPERGCSVISITGTNGKGSTALMIDSLLRSLGLRTGRVASPHLADVTERICIDGQPIAIEDFDRLVTEVMPLVEIVDAQALDGVRMSFFEVMTGLAFAAFAEAPVDVMILEVGLGGTWDATNVADATVAVLGPIDLDHTHILGDSVAEIATEKAGIIKAGATVVVAEQPNDAAVEVIAKRAAAVGASVLWAGRDFGLLDRQLAVGGQLLRIESPSGVFGDLFLPLFGEHLAQNAAVALASVSALIGGKDVEPSVWAEGFAEVTAPARLEVLRRSPSIVLDTCHNPHGIRATLAATREAFDFEPLITVVAMMRDKDVDEALRLFAEECSVLVATQVSSSDRGLPAAELAAKAREVLGSERVQVADNLADAIDVAVALADEAGGAAGILIVGSVVAAGEARTLLLRRASDED